MLPYSNSLWWGLQDTEETEHAQVEYYTVEALNSKIEIYKGGLVHCWKIVHPFVDPSPSSVKNRDSDWFIIQSWCMIGCDMEG